MVDRSLHLREKIVLEERSFCDLIFRIPWGFIHFFICMPDASQAYYESSNSQ